MKTRTGLVLSVLTWALPALAFSQDVPPPPPTPDMTPAAPAPPPAPVYAAPSAPPSAYAPGAYAPGAYPPGAYAPPPPGAVMVAPVQPYPYVYPPRGPYAQPLVLVPAPPLPSYQWSAAIDALFLERSGAGIQLGGTVYNPSPGLPPAVPPDGLYSDDAPFPLAAGLRLEVGRKITDNISITGTYWGLQQWSVGNTLDADPINDTVLAFSPYLQLPTLLNGLDNSLGYTYASQIENVEINAQFRLNPENPYWQVDWLWGARYVNLADQFTLTGIDSFNSATENLSSSTGNSLIGVQTGLLFVHGWDRFQWESGLKLGLMANVYRQHVTDTASDPSGIPAGFVPYDVSNNGTGLAAMVELSFAARLRLTNALWLRLGYQFYDFTGLALGPRQLTSFGHGGNVALDGLSIGLQATW